MKIFLILGVIFSLLTSGEFVWAQPSPALSVQEQITLLEDSIRTMDGEIANVESQIAQHKSDQNMATYITIPMSLITVVMAIATWNTWGIVGKLLFGAIPSAIGIRAYRTIQISNDKIPELEQTLFHLKAYQAARKARLERLKGEAVRALEKSIIDSVKKT